MHNVRGKPGGCEREKVELIEYQTKQNRGSPYPKDHDIPDRAPFPSRLKCDPLRTAHQAGQVVDRLFFDFLGVQAWEQFDGEHMYRALTLSSSIPSIIPIRQADR